MNYQKHYNLLCERAQNRQLDCYTEKHRILPGCMGGEYTPDNVAHLTAEEHYVAHQLLVKMYPGHWGLANAACMMSLNLNGQRPNNKLYGWLKRKHAQATSRQMKEQWQDPEYREHMSQRNKEQWQNPEYREKISRQRKEQWQDPEYRELKSKQNSQRMKEQWQDPEYREKISKQTSQQMKEYYKNNPEAREQNSKRIKEYWENNPEARKRQSHCRKKYYYNNPQIKEKFRHKMKEYWGNEEHKEQQSQRMKGRKMFHNPITGEIIMKFPNEIPKGFYPGRKPRENSING